MISCGWDVFLFVLHPVITAVIGLFDIKRSAHHIEGCHCSLLGGINVKVVIVLLISGIE